MSKPTIDIDEKGMQVRMSIPNGKEIPKGSPLISKNGRITEPLVLNEAKFKGTIASWGKNNLFPQELVEKIKKSPLLRPLIEKKTEAICSGGIVYGYMEIVDGKPKPQRLIIDEIERDLEKANPNLYLNEASRDWYSFNNAFAQGVLRKDGKIGQIYAQDTTMCRLTAQQEDTGKIEKCIVNANWKKGDMKHITVIPVLDHYYDLPSQVLALKNDKTFMIPLRSKCYGNVYYDDPQYMGIFESGWYDIHMEVPRFKQALMQKRVNIALEVAVNYEWWEWKYPGFAKKDDAGKRKIIRAESNAFMKEITDPDKRLQVIMTGFGIDPITRKENFGWIIKPIKLDENQKGYLEDSQEADLNIMRAMGLHSSTVGIASKNGLGAGSGSDMKMAYDQFILGQRTTLNRLLMPFQLMFDFNEYSETFKSVTKGKRLAVWSEAYLMATLNQTEDVSKSAKSKPKKTPTNVAD